MNFMDGLALVFFLGSSVYMIKEFIRFNKLQYPHKTLPKAMNIAVNVKEFPYFQNLSKPQIIEREEERLKNFWIEYFKDEGLSYQDHIGIEVYFDLAKADWIVCRTEALTHVGAIALERVAETLEKERKNGIFN